MIKANCVLTYNIMEKASKWGRVLSNRERKVRVLVTSMAQRRVSGGDASPHQGRNAIWAAGPCEVVPQTLEEEVGAWDSASKGPQSQEISSPGTAGSTTSGDFKETSQGLPVLFHPTLCYP